MTSPIYVAIDTPDMERARAIATAVKRHAGGLKLGLEFFCHNGRHGVMELAELALPIFRDLKLPDIPTPVAKSIQALAPHTPAVLTVHAAGGRGSLRSIRAIGSSARRSPVWCSGTGGQLTLAAVYHLGFPEVRNASLLAPVVGNGLFTLAYLLSRSALAPTLAHILMHAAAVLHGPGSRLPLPPHY